MAYTHKVAEYVFNFGINKKAVKDLLKELRLSENEYNIKRVLEVLQGTACIDIDYNTDTPKDVLPDLWDDKEKVKGLSPAHVPKTEYLVQVKVNYQDIDQALQKLDKEINERNVNYILQLMEATANMMIEGDLQDAKGIHDRMG